jgi:tetratricopeptide (TPR) repeat protein
MIYQAVALVCVAAGLIAVFAMHMRSTIQEMARERTEVDVQRLAASKSCSTQLLQPILAKYPNSRKIVNTWCQMAIEEEGWASDEAKSRTLEFCRRFPRYDYPRWLHSRVLQAAGEIDRAEAVLLEARRNDGDPETQFWLYRDYARIAERRGAWKEARDRWIIVQIKFPERAEGFLGEARALIQLGDHAGSRLRLAQALAAEPRSENALLQSAEVAAQDEDWDYAVSLWKTFRLSFETNPKGYLRGAEASYRAGDIKGAIALLDLAEHLFRSNDATMSERSRLNKLIIGKVEEPDGTKMCSKA